MRRDALAEQKQMGLSAAPSPRFSTESTIGYCPSRRKVSPLQRLIAEQYLKKGSKVYVEGQLRTRKWQDQEGADRYATEVHLQGFAGQITMLGDPKNGNGGDAKGRARRAERDGSPASRRARKVRAGGQARRRRDPLLNAPFDRTPRR